MSGGRRPTRRRRPVPVHDTIPDVERTAGAAPSPRTHEGDDSDSDGEARAAAGPGPLKAQLRGERATYDDALKNAREQSVQARLRELRRYCRFPEYPPTPSAANIYLEECAVRCPRLTTSETWRATADSLASVPRNVANACNEKAKALLQNELWDVRPVVPPHLRPSGDASLDTYRGQRGGRPQADLTRGARPPTRSAPFDQLFWKDLFPTTARRGATGTASGPTQAIAADLPPTSPPSDAPGTSRPKRTRKAPARMVEE